MLLSESMTVAVVLAALAGADPHAPVVLAVPYGDRCHTTQLVPLHMVKPLPESDIRESGYSDSGFALSDDAADPDEPIPEIDEGAPSFVALIS